MVHIVKKLVFQRAGFLEISVNDVDVLQTSPAERKLLSDIADAIQYYERTQSAMRPASTKPLSAADVMGG